MRAQGDVNQSLNHNLDKRQLESSAKPKHKSELGHAADGVLGFRLTELKHVIGLTKLNYQEPLGHAAVGVLRREAVGVFKSRPRLSHHVSHCVAPPAPAIGLRCLITPFTSARLIPCSRAGVTGIVGRVLGGCLVSPTTCFSSASLHSG